MAYQLKWKNRVEHFQNAFTDFIDNQFLCDVTLVGEGELFKAHQFVLAACSSYFKRIFKDVLPAQHPIIFLRDVTAQEIKSILDYMYKGEAVVSNDLLPRFLKTCELLHIQELCQDQNQIPRDSTNVSDTERQVLVAEPNLMTHLRKSPNTTKRRSEVIQENHGKSKQAKINHDLRGNQTVSSPKETEISNQSLNDLTQLQLQNSVILEDSTINTDILNSPPNSEESLVFSIQNPKNISHKQEKISNLSSDSIIFQIQNQEVLEISDDDHTDTSNKVICSSSFIQEYDNVEPNKDNEEVRESAHLQESDTDDSEIIVRYRGVVKNTAHSDEHAGTNNKQLRVVLSHLQIAADEGLEEDSNSSESFHLIPLQENDSDMHADSSIGGKTGENQEQTKKVTEQTFKAGPSDNKNVPVFRGKPTPACSFEKDGHFVSGIYESIEKVPEDMKRLYCTSCQRCVHPDLKQKHVRGHSLKFARNVYKNKKS